MADQMTTIELARARRAAETQRRRIAAYSKLRYEKVEVLLAEANRVIEAAQRNGAAQHD